MNAPIFISYRTSDGRDKATALARDLGAKFGDAQVFLGKDDLLGGSRWRDEIARALGAKPVLLLLLTPQLLSATDATGALRIADPNDPVRRELGAALQAGAHIVPLCCDGVDAPPAGAALPAPFDCLGEFTWRRLRAYDWKNDLARLEGDLLALGVQPCAEPVPMRVRTTRRVALLGLGLGGAAIGTVLTQPGLPLTLDLAWKVFNGAAATPRSTAATCTSRRRPTVAASRAGSGRMAIRPSAASSCAGRRAQVVDT